MDKNRLAEIPPMGCELRKCDEWTLMLITNVEVLRILNHSKGGHQAYRKKAKSAFFLIINSVLI